jgi:hypothetical protein
MLKANMAAADALTFLNSSALSPNSSSIPIRGVVAALSQFDAVRSRQIPKNPAR